MKKLTILTLGCKKNLVDSEKLLYLLKNKYIFIDNPLEADILIINTCGFIDDAKKENTELIKYYCSLKKQNKIEKIIVFGCLVQVMADELKTLFPEVDYFFGANNINEVSKALLKNSDISLESSINREFISPLPSAYLKIAEGCDHKCSFCSIPYIRGNQVSINIEDLINEAKIIREKQYKELILIAQDTSNYGSDLYGKKMLPELLEKIADIDFDWIRLMYAYPTAFPERALHIINERDNICKYIDIPLQHISDHILKSMKRGIDKKSTINLIEKIKKIIPKCAIRSTFIIGYPNESEADFIELLDFIKNTELDRVGAFLYSPQKFTYSYQLEDNVPKEAKEERYKEFMLLQQQISLKKNKRLLGKKLKVLIDHKDEDFFYGRTEYDAPEVDNEVLIKIRRNLELNKFYPLTIKNYNEYQLFA